MTTNSPRVDYSRSIIATGWGLFSRGSVFFVFKWPLIILIGGGIAIPLTWMFQHPISFLLAPVIILAFCFWLCWMQVGREMRAERRNQ